MLTDYELEALLQDTESDRAERKASAADKDKICQAVCAFANDLPDHRLPGVIFVGANDDGSCSNLEITDSLLLNLAGIRSDGNILPPPMMAVQKKNINGCTLVIIEVQPTYDPPVRYNGRTWIRVGPRRGTATIDEERRLTEKRRAGNLSFDHQPAFGTGIEDLDMVLFQRTYLPAAVSPETLAENGRSQEEQLASLHFLTKEGKPNNGALITLGLDAQTWIPGAYVQFIRIAGTELGDTIIHQEEISGALPDLLSKLDEVLNANISVATDIISGPVEIQQPDYPISALQQLSYNAVLHRTYEATNSPTYIYWFSDKIEIHSPGGPYGRVSQADFGKPGVVDYRNPLLAEAMKTLGYVQKFGFGIQIARREMKKNNNPDLEYTIEASRILATIRRRR